MEILQLKYFKSVAIKENITETAKEYMVPASSVSSSIKRLENELGCKLFNRTANKIQLNACGRILLDAVNTFDDAVKNAKKEILNLSKMPSGEIKLLILTNRQILTEAISEFKRKYTNITFTIKHEDYFDYKGYNNYDIIISDRIISSESFKSIPFIDEEIFVALHRDNPLSKKSCISLTELKNEKLISLPKGSSLRDYVDKLFQNHNFSPIITIECDDPYYIREYLDMGLGITFFPIVSWKNKITDNIKLVSLNKKIYRKSFIYVNKKSNDTVNIFVDDLISKNLYLSHQQNFQSK